MKLHTSGATYGLVAIVLHWLIAIVTFGLFGLGLWITSLTYYNAWYVTGPRLYEGIGVLLFFTLLLRLLFRWFNPTLFHWKVTIVWKKLVQNMSMYY